MANLGLITADIDHPSIAPIRVLLVANGHTVTLMADSATEVSELLTFDAVLAARYTDTQAEFSKLLSAFNNGVPIMTGSIAGTPPPNVSINELSVLAGITSGMKVGASSSSQVYAEISDLDFYPANLQGQVISVYNNNTFAYSYVTPFSNGTRIHGYLQDGTGITDLPNVITCESGTLNLSGQPTPARFIGNGFLYGLAGFTPVQESALLNMVVWLTSVAESYNVNGTVTLDGQPYSSRVVATSVNSEPAVVGTAISDESGNYTIGTGSYNGAVLVHSIQDYGINWSPSTVLEINQVVHPTVPNGYVFRVTTVGTTDTTEPTWPALPSTQVADGGVTYTSEILLEPVIQGYIQTQLI